MAEHIDKEIEAIKTILHSLEPLSPEVRASVLKYVVERLQIVPTTSHRIRPVDISAPYNGASPAYENTETEPRSAPTHIKNLKEKKKPRSANEMAALVAYYLAHEVPLKDRKDTIAAKDITTYFRIAEFPLPRESRYTLSNAKAAGYLDAVGSGEYKLNAVGYNLVVHSMPRGESGKGTRKRKPVKKNLLPTTPK